MNLVPLNTVESELILHQEEKMREFDTAALAALERVRSNLDGATMRSVVTVYTKRRSILGFRYYKTHVMEYATWRVPHSDVLFLCSDGKMYAEDSVRNFWGVKVKRLMPVEVTTPGTYHGHCIDHDDFIDLLNKMDKPGNITGWG